MERCSSNTLLREGLLVDSNSDDALLAISLLDGVPNDRAW